MKVKNILLFLLLILSLVPLFDLLHQGLPITHDGQDHVARIANFYQNLKEGIIIPRWAGNLNWGYGHPILMFLYPLPSYIASLFHLFGFSFVDATKLVFALSFILSGLTMYLWTKSILNEKAGFVAGLLYMFAPYRFVDLYVRGAIGEHVAFIFPPLILYFFYKLSKKIRWTHMLGGSLSLAGFILAHNAITLMFLPIFFLYIIYLLFFSKQKNNIVVGSFLSALFGFGLSAFFWLPAFFEGKYTLRDIVTKGEYDGRFVKMGDLIYGLWDYGGTGQFTVQLGILHWLFVIVGLILFFILLRKDKKFAVLLGGLIGVLIFSLYIMLPYSGFVWKSITTLQKFQFPWRFLSVSVFATSVIGGLCMHLVPKRFQPLVLVAFVIGILWVNKDYWHARGFMQKEESFYSSVYNGTTDTGESSPIWSIRFMLKRPTASLETIEGVANIQPIYQTFTKHSYEVIAKERVRMRENTLYFPGWSVYDNGKEMSVEFQDPRHRGLLTFYLDSGKHDIIVWFKETKLRILANSISGVSFAILFLVSIRYLVWKRFL